MADSRVCSLCGKADGPGGCSCGDADGSGGSSTAAVSAAVTAATRRIRPWGWGYEDQGVTPALLKRVSAVLSAAFDVDVASMPPVGTVSHLSDIVLTPPRFGIDDPAIAALAATGADATYHRVRCSYGMSFHDILWCLQGAKNVVDYVLFPRSESDVVAILAYCSRRRIAVMTRGGGSSVTGGTRPLEQLGDYTGSVCVDLKEMAAVLDLNAVNRIVHVQAGMYGPALEAELSKHGLTLRHFPQSFEMSTVGGWVATRAGGHFATGRTHIDEMVHALRVVTPTGIVETPHVPESGAGPEPKRMFIGCEGALGIITSVWLRVQAKPKYRAAATVTFPEFVQGAAAVRDICQAGLLPANCRLVSPMEAAPMGLGDGQSAVLLIAFESMVSTEFSSELAACKAICAKHTGEWHAARVAQEEDAGARDGPAGEWRSSFVNAPYLRDFLASRGCVVETFETSVNWDKFDEFHAGVTSAVESAIHAAHGVGHIMCRTTHAYSDGCAPYYTVIMFPASGTPTIDFAMNGWAAVKKAANEAIQRFGGTCTHHHAVGRDHVPYFAHQVGPMWMRILTAVKLTLDPMWILNPGVLIPNTMRLAKL